MRINKFFRGWDEQKQEMSPPFEIGSQFSMLAWDDVMQCIGEKDSNNVDIFEGDYLSIDGHSELEGVIWWNGGFYTALSSYPLTGDVISSYKIQVIGNEHNKANAHDAEKARRK